jgi:hypothetical protein
VPGEKVIDLILCRKSFACFTEDKATAGVHPAAETAVPSVLPWASCLQIVGPAGPGEVYADRLSNVHRLSRNHAVDS